MEEEEIQKRNTDCVYFLASPLTCKKSMECEYRHSEIARLNPRDCWYWLAGSCLNPTCAFRHPPLEGRTEPFSKSAAPHNQSAVTASKTNVPCYFYFNGFCSKGDHCSFLHSLNDVAPALISSKTASAVTDALAIDTKASAAVDTGIAPIRTRSNSHEQILKEAEEIQIDFKHLDQSTTNTMAKQTASPHVSASSCEEAVEASSDILISAEGFVQTKSLVRTDQSSEDQVDSHIEHEEWLESSPGFDVLVDDGSENLGNEDDPEYLLDREGIEFNGQFLGYDYEDPVEYDPAYPDVGSLYDQEIHDSYDDRMDAEHAYDYVRKSPMRSRERTLDHIFPQKRKFFPMERAFNGRSGMDLRDHLKKRSVVNTCSEHFSRRLHSSSLNDLSRKRPPWLGTRRLPGRLASKVEINIVGSRSENQAPFNGANLRSRLRHFPVNRSRQHFKERRQGKQNFHSSEIRRKSSASSKGRRSTEESTVFTGPKTLAQIKEEKTKAQESGDNLGRTGPSSITTSEDFQRPKPPSEILKDKTSWGSIRMNMSRIS